jgi:bifunctional non-homologous end joining protein LigD
VIDGEVVALDDKGRPSFQLLQNFRQHHAARGLHLVYYVFDLLNLENRDLKKLPLEQRRELLQATIGKAGERSAFREASMAILKTSSSKPAPTASKALSPSAGNRSDEPDRRSGSWLKVKTVMEQEFVIGGSPSQKGRANTLVRCSSATIRRRNSCSPRRSALASAPTHCTTSIKRFKKLETPVCPFVNLPTKGPNGLSRAEMRRCTWMLPCARLPGALHRMDQRRRPPPPVFLGLRDDKRPHDVHREVPQ